MQADDGGRPVDMVAVIVASRGAALEIAAPLRITPARPCSWLYAALAG